MRRGRGGANVNIASIRHGGRVERHQRAFRTTTSRRRIQPNNDQTGFISGDRRNSPDLSRLWLDRHGTSAEALGISVARGAYGAACRPGYLRPIRFGRDRPARRRCIVGMPHYCPRGQSSRPFSSTGETGGYRTARGSEKRRSPWNEKTDLSLRQ